jgi:two-component system, sensor histidine kinase and response regulator
MKSTTNVSGKLFAVLKSIRNIGVTDEMDSYAKRRLGIFNLINFFGFVTGLVLPVTAMFTDGYLPPVAWVVAAAPAFISLGVLVSNYLLRHNFAMLWYFMLYPWVTSLVYMNNIDVGIELFFIFYAVLAVFFLQKAWHVFLSVTFSLLCFSLVYVVKHDYTFVMADINYSFYVLNHVLSLLFIFGGLFLIKKENIDYQAEILSSNEELNAYNIEIEKQKEELTELNNLKNKLFSVISHDIRTPLYGLRNLFKSFHEIDLPAEEIKQMLPDVVKDLTSSTDLMENLLQWAKSQMKGEQVAFEIVDLNKVIADMLSVLRLQAESKKIELVFHRNTAALVFADRGMMETVVRNLISNAIKFTPAAGGVTVNVEESGELIDVSITDTGIGMSEETIAKVLKEEYFTTNGTANESGTGLGLMICKDFIKKNGSTLSVNSKPGNGTTFRFSLPKYETA